MYVTYKMQNNIQGAGWWTVINFVIHVQNWKYSKRAIMTYIWLNQPTEKQHLGNIIMKYDTDLW